MAKKSSKEADLEPLERLEQKVQLLIETIEHMRNENSLLKTENKRLTQDLDSTHSRLTQTEGAKADRILNLCQRMKATHYLTGSLARNYLSQEDFSQKGIELEYQEYNHPKYSQRYPGFIPNLSLIDLLFNVGDESLDVLMHSITK